MGSAFYAITDDLLKAIWYPEDARDSPFLRWKSLSALLAKLRNGEFFD